jgi:hypothetical protein
MSNDKIVPPVVGMGATNCMWSDRKPYTVVEVLKSGKRCVLQADNYTRVDKNGMSESQSYIYEPDPNGSKVTVSLRKDGRWRAVGSSSDVYSIGVRSAYHDFSF